MNEKKRLPKPPLFTSDYIAMAEILKFAMDQFGQLVLALMYYTMDGTEPEDLSPDLRIMFSIYQRKIDAAREKYEKMCETRAESGAKGGRAKAANTKAQSSVSKFKAPTQKQFQNAVSHFVDNDEIDEPDSYEIESFFDKMTEAGWTIGGEPILSRSDWETVIRAKFYEPHVELPSHLYYSAFAKVFSDFQGLRDENGRCQADDAVSEFIDTYNESSKQWIVNGEDFPVVAWRDALDRFMEHYGKQSKRSSS